MAKKLINGVGVNDADFPVTYISDGKRVMVLSYDKYKHICRRSSAKYHIKYPTYKGVSLCDEWAASYISFHKWFEENYIDGCHLDKDLMHPGNKIYGPDKCVFVAPQINSFLCDCAAYRGQYKIGVHFCKNNNSFKSQININNKRTSLGYFKTEDEAHEAWKEQKIIQFNKLINDPKNDYIKSGLIEHRDLL